MALEELDTVKINLAITSSDDDVLLSDLQSSADELIARRTGRSFAGGTFTERHDGGRFVFLANFPVETIESVKVDRAGIFGDDTLVSPSEYTLMADRGVIVARMLGGPGWSHAVQVIYTTTANVPADLRRAYAELIGHWYRQAKTSAHLGYLNVLSKADANGETRYLSPNANIPSGVLRVLDAYRVPHV